MTKQHKAARAHLAVCRAHIATGYHKYSNRGTSAYSGGAAIFEPLKATIFDAFQSVKTDGKAGSLPNGIVTPVISLDMPTVTQTT